MARRKFITAGGNMSDNTAPTDPTTVDTEIDSVNSTVDTEVTEVETPAPEPVADEPVAEEAVPEAPAPEPVQPQAPAPQQPRLVRVELVKNSLESFAASFPTSKPLTPRDHQAMPRAIEGMVNAMLTSTTYQEVATIASMLRDAFFRNEGNVFARSRILGQMREPRSGRLNVQHARTVELVALLYTTASPKTFNAQKGRIDITTALIGCPETSAQFLRQYFGQ